jgi:4-diphosphocytidyl-2-C-methyl-D-erythritol kinase
LDGVDPEGAGPAGEVAVSQDLAGASRSVRIAAPAKINLTLAVWGKRPDGLHEIESVVVPVGLYDELVLSEAHGPDIRLLCDDPAVPDGQENLVCQAAARLAERAGDRRGVQIRLTKRIPVGAGLGGGSSDAAATLVGLNRLWQTGLSDSELADIGAGLGSDVPLFVHGGAVIIRGRGERVESIRLGWSGWIVLVVPRFGMSTARVYGDWEPTEPPPRSARDVVEAARAGQDLSELLYNMLEPPAFAVEPRIAALHAKLIELGATRARMSGSGSGLFALFGESSQAEAFAARVARQLETNVYVVRTTECEHQSCEHL